MKTLEFQTIERQGRRRARQRAREVSWKHSTLRRCRQCGRKRGHLNQDIEIRKTPEGVAHFTNVALCGSVWACAVCSPKIRQGRAEEIDKALVWWLERYGAGSVMLLTLTLPHWFGERLEPLMQLIKGGWSDLLSGRAWSGSWNKRHTVFTIGDKQRYGILHWIRSWDATHGRNGWHPHFHILLFADHCVDEAERVLIKERLFERWHHGITRRGHRAPTYEHGINLQVARTRKELANYVMKVVYGEETDKPRSVAMELARGDLKKNRMGGRSPFEIHASVAERGDPHDLELWREWEQVTHGERFIQWSQKFKTLVGVNERTDEDIAEEEVGGETLHRFTREEWAATCKTPRAQSRMLELAEGPHPHEAVAEYARELAQGFRTERWRRSKEGESVPITEVYSVVSETEPPLQANRRRGSRGRRSGLRVLPRGDAA